MLQFEGFPTRKTFTNNYCTFSMFGVEGIWPCTSHRPPLTPKVVCHHSRISNLDNTKLHSTIFDRVIPPSSCSLENNWFPALVQSGRLFSPHSALLSKNPEKQQTWTKRQYTHKIPSQTPNLTDFYSKPWKKNHFKCYKPQVLSSCPPPTPFWKINHAKCLAQVTWP